MNGRGCGDFWRSLISALFFEIFSESARRCGQLKVFEFKCDLKNSLFEVRGKSCQWSLGHWYCCQLAFIAAWTNDTTLRIIINDHCCFENGVSHRILVRRLASGYCFCCSHCLVKGKLGFPRVFEEGGGCRPSSSSTLCEP